MKPERKSEMLKNEWVAHRHGLTRERAAAGRPARGSCARFGKELGQIPHAMKDAQDHNHIAARLVENQVIPEACHRPGADADKFAKAALGADVGGFGNKFESFFRRLQQPVRGWQVVARDIAPVAFKVEPGASLDEVIHRRREPFLCSP